MLDSFAERAAALDDTEAFKDLMADELDRLGFERFSHVALRIPNGGDVPFALSTYPAAWCEHYLAQDYVHLDPVLQAASASMQPFDWGQLSRGRNMTPRQRRMMKEAVDFGVHKGLTVPIHGPNGSFAILSLLSQESSREFERICQTRMMEIHMLALYFHSALDNNIIQQGADPRVYLTDRERDTLAWTAKGKTSWEASEILKVSEDTVNFHLKNVMKKYAVNSKHHAVVKAIMSGQIFP